ncbi:MAG: acetylxylan esterase [Candidatus Latescibacterota bacterium]|jgi:hypothetical protein
MQRALAAKLVGRRADRELKAFLKSRLPHWQVPESAAAWPRQAAALRHRVLELFFRGHEAGLLDLEPRVEWAGVLETGQGYRIRKLRYEGYPGMWIPALLYEPARLRGRVPVVLNPNGHHAGGKAMEYKQARCINLAKRGVLALNTEFIGMGELRADVEHNRIAHLDLCGLAGIAVFYLAVKRGLDLLLAHPHADRSRVAMTGLSGGGWQTAVLSALDERIGVVIPVAGHSPVWQRVDHPSDIGDVEQIPSDLCTAADFDALTALFAPRPTLLIYNHHDNCCFATGRTRRSVYRPVKPLFELLGVADRLAFHDNLDPGTHNYEADNRSQFYRFLNRHFGLDAPVIDLPWEEELFTEQELRVGLSPENATLLSLSQQALTRIRRERTRRRPSRTPKPARARLAALLHLPDLGPARARQVRREEERPDFTVRHHLLSVGGWSLPVTELAPPEARGVEVIVSDGGRAAAGPQVLPALVAGRRVVVADLLGNGELQTTWQYHMLLAGTGERPLGLQVAQLLAVVRWCRSRFRARTVHLHAVGQVIPVVGLTAAALEPTAFASLTTEVLMDSLDRLIDWPVPYANAAPLFCFGLLREFDLPDLIELSAPVPLLDANRGPLRVSRTKR